MITPEYNNSRNNNRLLLLMEKASLTFSISQLSNPSPVIFYSFWEYEITPKDIRLVLLSTERQQAIWPHPGEQQASMLTVWHLFTIFSPLSLLTLVLLDRFLRAKCSCHTSSITDDVQHISMSLLRSPRIAQWTAIFTMQFHILTGSLSPGLFLWEPKQIHDQEDKWYPLPLATGRGELDGEWGRVWAGLWGLQIRSRGPHRSGLKNGQRGGWCGREGGWWRTRGWEPREME